MKKYLLTIILFILIIPTVVLAGTCNPSDVEIKTVTLSRTMGTGEEVTAASVNNKSINLDVKLNNPNDYMEYTITVKNNGTEDYYIKEADFNNDQYLKYEFVHENGTYKIEPNTEKEITLRVSYIDRVEGSSNYTTTDSLELNILDKQDVGIANTLMNLSLSYKIIIFILILLIATGLFILFANKKKSRNIIILLIGMVIFIPINTNASCDAKIDVDVKVELDNKNAIFKTGGKINILMKTLAGASSPTVNSSNNTITAIKKSSTEPIDANKNVASADDSPLPIYMWFDNGTIWWWSEDDNPSLNQNSNNLFINLRKLSLIDDLSYFDVSNVEEIGDLFTYDAKITDITPISNWNTSKVSIMAYMLYGTKITSLLPLKNWDTSNVTSLFTAFGIDTITTLDGLENWNTSKVENLTCIFVGMTNLIDIKAIKNWDTSSVTTMQNMFAANSSLSDISALSSWDTSNVTNMSAAFANCENLTNIDAIANWDVSKVTEFTFMFASLPNITSVDLSKWDAKSAQNLQKMFINCSSLETVDISGFDTSNVTSFVEMFNGSTSLSTIYIGDKWNISSNTGDASKVFPTSSNLPNFDSNDSTKQNLSWEKPTTEGGYLTLKTNT